MLEAIETRANFHIFGICIRTQIVFLSFFSIQSCTPISMFGHHFLFQKYGKFCSILLEHYIKHKSIISEECNPQWARKHKKSPVEKTREIK